MLILIRMLIFFISQKIEDFSRFLNVKRDRSNVAKHIKYFIHIYHTYLSIRIIQTRFVFYAQRSINKNRNDRNSTSVVEQLMLSRL